MNRSARIVVGACVFASLLLCSVQAAVLVKSYQDLLRDKKVMLAKRRYEALSAASVVYDKCAKPYKFSQDQIDFQKATYVKFAAAYMEAFHDSYTGLVHGEPDQELVDSYADYARKSQQYVVNQTMKSINELKHCANGDIKDIVRYVEDLHYADTYAKMKEEQKHAPKPALTMDQTPATATPITPTPEDMNGDGIPDNQQQNIVPPAAPGSN